MLTITITPRAVLLAAAFTLVGVLGFIATDALGSGMPDSILQGDTDCDGDVDAQDALIGLRFVGGLDVQQSEPCPDVGTLAAIPGPQGPQGSQGPAGPAAENLTAKVLSDGELAGGTAVSASRITVGHYVITFDQDVSGCAAAGGAGFNGQSSVFRTLATTSFNPLNMDSVEVSLWNTNGLSTDSDFSLIVAC